MGGADLFVAPTGNRTCHSRSRDLAFYKQKRLKHHSFRLVPHIGSTGPFFFFFFAPAVPHCCLILISSATDSWWIWFTGRSRTSQTLHPLLPAKLGRKKIDLKNSVLNNHTFPTDEKVNSAFLQCRLLPGKSSLPSIINDIKKIHK